MKKRVISIILTLAIVVSLAPAMGITASADNRFGNQIGVIDPLFDTGSITSTNAFLRDDSNFNSTVLVAVNTGLTALKLPSVSGLPSVTASSVWFGQAKSILSTVGYGRHDRIDLERFVYRLNSIFSDINSKTIVGPLVSAPALQYFIPSLTVRNDWVSLKQTTVMLNGNLTLINRPWFNVTSTTGFWLVDSAGGYPYSVVQNAPTSTVSYGYYNINSAVVNDTGLISNADLITFAAEYPYLGQIKTKTYQIGDYSYVGVQQGSTNIVLCKTVGGVNYALHSAYRNQNTGTPPTTILDPGFQTTLGNGYVLNTRSSTGLKFALANQFDFQAAASYPDTSVINLDVKGTDGTIYPMYALSYGALSGNYSLDLSTGNTNIPASALLYYKMSDTAAKIFNAGNSQLLVPYVMGGNTPGVEWDCSAFVSYCLTQAGVWSYGRVNAQFLYEHTSRITAAELLPGDLVFFTGTYQTSDPVTHVGIYAGAGMMLNAGGSYVQYTNISKSSYADKIYGYGRVGDYVSNNLVLYPRTSDAYAAGDSFKYFSVGVDNNFTQGDTFDTQFINYGDSTVINISGGDGFSNVGGDAITLYLDDLIYDESTKTYSSMSHSAYELQNGDNYITVNYNYEYNFFIDYTSITYIGTTADANETYNFYYELPDGRSSADLSGDDLLALNTQIDVIPYSRSSDDTSLRSLYHFNGNTADSSYWNLQTSFTWNDGASITYLDAGQNFQGALYLDELNHDFTITLPSALGTEDFTFEFRYYQSYTAAPQTDSYIQFGTNTFLQFDGAHYKNSSGTTITDTSIGNWNALCLMRSEGTLYFFVNGVPYSLDINSAVLPADITFHFGTSQQTYKQLDELRVVNRAVYSTSGYTPASSQFDTNLSLVLPGTATPVADEYWDIDMTGTNLLSQHNLDWWDASHTDSGFYSSSFTPVSTSSGYSNLFSLNGNYISSRVKSNYFPSLFSFYYDTSSISWSVGDYISFSSSYDMTALLYGDRFAYMQAYLSLSNALSFPLYFSTNASVSIPSYLNAGDYVFSFVSSTGDILEFPFHSYGADWTSYWPVYTQGSSNYFLYYSNPVSFNGYSFFLLYSGRGYEKTNVSLCIVPSSSPGEFVYMALEEGSTSTVSAEFVTSIVPIETSSLNTPTLAVRTDIDITSWNIGGVRPSIPEKGMAWALVEDGIITSLQVYDGQGWVNVDGRIWTGQRFVPLGSYNVLTMNDLLDIIGNSPGYTPIYTENGFWKWLQGAWQDMIALLTEIRDRLSGDGSQDDDGGGGHWWDNDADSDSDTDDGGLLDLFKTVLRGLIKVGNGILGLAFNGLESLVDWIGGIGDFFGYYSADSPNNIWQVPVEVTPTP